MQYRGRGCYYGPFGFIERYNPAVELMILVAAIWKIKVDIYICLEFLTKKTTI